VGGNRGILPDYAGYLLLALAAVLLLWRQRAPVPVLAAVLITAGLYRALGFPSGAFTVAPAIAVYVVITGGRRLAGHLGAAAFLAFVLLLDANPVQEPSREGGVWLVVWMTAVVTAAELRLRWSRQQAAAEPRDQADVVAKVDQERRRIAHDLHDILSHNLSVISIQAGVAEHLIARNPRQAQRAVTLISELSRDLMAELRSTLGVLGAGCGLGALHDLVERVEAAGLRVLLDMPSRPPRMPMAVETAVYRIVQEALTNVIRHSGAAEARVRVAVTGDELVVRVEDDGPDPGMEPPRRTGLPAARVPSLPNGGLGIPGMRERAAAVGGTLTAGESEKGGFVVEARLPIRDGEA